jgi:hypothetical protein
MKRQSTLLLTGALLALSVVPPAQAAVSGRMEVNGFGGDLRVFLSLPSSCSDVDQTTFVSQGTMEFLAGEADASGVRSFVLTRADVFFTPFTIHKSCLTEDVTLDYTQAAVQLGRATSFKAAPSSPGIYPAVIPKEDVLVYEASRVNGELETGYKQPVDDVTATIDFAHGTVQVKVVLGLTVHLKGGCVPIVGCAIDEDRHGSLTATFGGRITFRDSDHDGVPDGADNCRLTANPDQRPVSTPVIQLPPSRVLPSCIDPQIGVATGLDLCDGKLLRVSNNAPTPFPSGTTRVSWQVEDTQGRSAAGVQSVTVADSTPPVFTSTPPDVALNDCGPAALGAPTATDDCGGSPRFTNNAPAKFGPGPRVVTWTATDLAGNEATATQTVTVTDTVAPMAACLPVSPPILFPSPGLLFGVSAADACGGPQIRLGTYTLRSGETISITPSTRPGVVLLRVGPDGTKYFQVGPGEGVITATDRAGNTGAARCLAVR